MPTVALPAGTLANVIWPALELTGGLMTWWVIAAGLVIEWPFVKVAASRGWGWSAAMTSVMNGVSAGLGLFLIPISGVLLEVVASLSWNNWPGWGTYNPVTWTLTFVLAAAVNAGIETACLKAAKVARLRRAFWLLLLANAVTVWLAVAFVPVELTGFFRSD